MLAVSADSSAATIRAPFTKRRNEIQAQVVAADVDGDGALELIAADAAGSIAAWRADGTPVWEVQTSGLCAQGVTLTQSLRNDGSVQVSARVAPAPSISIVIAIVVALVSRR